MADAPTAPAWVRPAAKVMVRTSGGAWQTGLIDRVYKRYCTLEGDPSRARYMYQPEGSSPAYNPGDRWAPRRFLHDWDEPESVAARDRIRLHNRQRKAADRIAQWQRTDNITHAREAVAVLQRAIEAADEREAAPDVASAP